jgi:tryptophanyl-tRNA synthetase
VERLLRFYADARERYAELVAHPARVDGILDEGAARLKPIADATLAEVHDKMGLR